MSDDGTVTPEAILRHLSQTGLIDRQPRTEAGRRLVMRVLGSPDDPAIAEVAAQLRAAVVAVEDEARRLLDPDS